MAHPPFVDLEPADDGYIITGYDVNFTTPDGKEFTHEADTISGAFWLQDQYSHLGTSKIVPRIADSHG